MQLYRLERYSECRSVYTDLIRNSQDEYEEERKTNLTAVVASMSQWENTPVVSMMRLCALYLHFLLFLKSWWGLFWVFVGSSGSTWIKLWAVLQCCLCFDWPRKTDGGLQQTTTSRGSVLSVLLCWVQLRNQKPLKWIYIFSLTELCRVSLAEDSVSSVAFFQF